MCCLLPIVTSIACISLSVTYQLLTSSVLFFLWYPLFTLRSLLLNCKLIYCIAGCFFTRDISIAACVVFVGFLRGRGWLANWLIVDFFNTQRRACVLHDLLGFSRDVVLFLFLKTKFLLTYCSCFIQFEIYNDVHTSFAFSSVKYFFFSYLQKYNYIFY